MFKYMCIALDFTGVQQFNLCQLLSQYQELGFVNQPSHKFSTNVLSNDYAIILTPAIWVRLYDCSTNAVVFIGGY